MTKFCCTTAELASPEFIRLLAIATAKEEKRLARLRAARRALGIANKLKNKIAQAKHKSRIFSQLNKLRAA